MLLQEFHWRREVIASEERVLVDFWASWCGPCRMMNPAVEALARDFKVAKVNIDRNQQLATHYGINAVPTVLVFKGGKPVARHVGLRSEADLRAEMLRWTGEQAAK